MELAEGIGLDALVFAPHPDDAEVGMAGTIAKMVAAGARVGVVELTRGERGTKGNAETRAAEAERAAAVLGVQWRRNLDLGDGALADTPENRLRAVDAVREARPRLLFATAPFDRHPDHKAAAELAAAAFFLARLPKYESRFPAWTPSRCFHYFMHDIRDAAFLVDITQFMDKKREALRAFESQFVNFEVPETYRHAGMGDYLTQVEAANRALGIQIGADYAEGFYAASPPAVETPLVLG